MNAASFGDLYGKHGADVYRFALYLSGDPAAAEDIAAETFLRVWTSPADVRFPTVRAYLLAIARNVFRHELRHTRRQEEVDPETPARGSLEAEVEARDRLRRVLAALQELPEVDRSALLLRALEEMPYEEIARLLGLSLASAKVKVHRARARLAEMTKGSGVCR